MRLKWIGAAALSCAVFVTSTHHALAQDAPAAPPPGAPPPAQAAPAPGGYPPPSYPGYPPPGYAPYGQPPSAPPYLPYREGDSIPPGYRLQEKTRTGLVIGGAVLTGVPYIMGLTFASANDFKNESGWLAVPVLGPWLTLSQRDSSCDEQGVSEAVECVGDVWLGMVLVLDGLMQAGGATMFLLGLTLTKTRLVREDLAPLTLRPARIGSGHGLALRGAF